MGYAESLQRKNTSGWKARSFLLDPRKIEQLLYGCSQLRRNYQRHLPRWNRHAVLHGIDRLARHPDQLCEFRLCQLLLATPLPSTPPQKDALTVI